MSANSKIEWTGDTWNAVTGCTRASSGCDNCYAVRMSHRLENMGQEKYRGLTVLNGKGDRHFNGTVKLHESELQTPLRRRRPTTYFVCSMSDLFHRDVPFEFIDRVFAVMALCPHHTFQVLTKRPERMAEYLYPLRAGDVGLAMDRMLGLKESHRKWTGHPWPLLNVWLGTSGENQDELDRRVGPLLKCPAAVRFLSVEPLLGAVDLGLIGTIPNDISREYRLVYERISWAICGGESGPNARPCDVAWIRSVVQQCKAAQVPVFVKQLGVRPFDADMVGVLPPGVTFGRKKTPDSIPNAWPDGTRFETAPRESDAVWECTGFAKLADKKGGEMSEWPSDLRVREMPDVQHGG